MSDATVLCEPVPAARHGSLSASWAAVRCLLRGLPLFLGARPKTPLRVLCMIVFDTLHVLRTSRPLSREKLEVLAAALDFGACANAALDHKDYCPHEYQTLRERLLKAGVGPTVEEYVRQLWQLERRRPSPGGDEGRHDEVRWYRETVARLSLRFVAAIAFGDERLEGELGATHRDADLETPFRIVMQCQIIDDVLDYAEDASAGLPSFLTASASLPRAIELTARAARHYALCSDLPHSNGALPLRAALIAVAAVAKIVLRLGPWRFVVPPSRCVVTSSDVAAASATSRDASSARCSPPRR